MRCARARLKRARHTLGVLIPVSSWAQADVRHLLDYLRAGKSGWWSSQDLGAISSRRAVYRPPAERVPDAGAPGHAEAKPPVVHAA